jgi:hypothetical protein
MAQWAGALRCPNQPAICFVAEVLSNLFKQDEIAEIEADIASHLLHCYPEPCWEDDFCKFLQV